MTVKGMDNVGIVAEDIDAAMSTGRRWPSRKLLCILLFAAAFGFGDQARGQPAESARFKDYEFNQYIISSALAPANILHLDSNGDLVLAARRGTTRAGLQAMGLSFSESQIALLETFRLLEENSDTLRVSFPILGPKETGRLRQEVRAVAPALVRRVEPQIGELRKALDRAGRGRNAYSIMFSYVLDGLVWREFESSNMLDRRELTAETPLWSGQVWALFPPRVFSPGTNSLSDGGVSLKVTWSEEAIPQMLPFVTDVSTLERMFDDYRSLGFVRDEHAREVFGPFDLFDKVGRLTVPVIDENSSNELYRSATGIARGVAASAPALLPLSTLAQQLHLPDQKCALIIAYHELMWDVMDQLEERKLVQKPVAFATPTKAKPADIAALVFVVKGSH